MSFLRLTLAVGALTLSIAFSTFAGEMHTPVASPPPPEVGEMETGAAATGDISCPGVSDSVTEIALSFVQNMLSLF
jgi:hypothetical protein